MTQVKCDYYKQFFIDYRNIKEEGKPKLLLHVCCGACSCYPLIFLTELFDITILFSNSNIFPKEEYDKRLNTLKEYVTKIEKDLNTKINIIEDDYNHTNFIKDLIPYKDEKEGGKRCEICIKKRMRRLFEYATKNNFKYVTTVMSISRNKNSLFINELGSYLEDEYKNIKFIHADFKRDGGQELGIKLSTKYNVYRQNYCGCEFSLLNRKK